MVRDTLKNLLGDRLLGAWGSQRPRCGYYSHAPGPGCVGGAVFVSCSGPPSPRTRLAHLEGSSGSLYTR